MGYTVRDIYSPRVRGYQVSCSDGRTWLGEAANWMQAMATAGEAWELDLDVSVVSERLPNGRMLVHLVRSGERLVVERAELPPPAPEPPALAEVAPLDELDEADLLEPVEEAEELEELDADALMSLGAPL